MTDLLIRISRMLAARWQILLIGIAVLSLLSFLLYGIDKYKARRGKWRISEKTLLLSAFFFGAIGAFFGMKLFRHKTQHLKFRILVPLFLLLQTAVYFLIPIFAFFI